MRCASETRRNRCAVAVEAPRAAVLDDLEARLVVAVEQLVGDPAGWRLVGQLERLGAEPLDADDRDDLLRQDAADGGVGLEVFEASHVFSRTSFYFTAKASPARGNTFADVASLPCPGCNVIKFMWSLITINPHLTNTIHFGSTIESHARKLPDSLI